jgi:hypothetical protein
MATAAGKPVFLVTFHDDYYDVDVVALIPNIPSTVKEYLDSVDELCDELEKKRSKAW